MEQKATSHEHSTTTKKSINHRLRDSPPRRISRSPSSSPDPRRSHHGRRRSRSPRHGSSRRQQRFDPRNDRSGRRHGSGDDRRDKRYQQFRSRGVEDRGNGEVAGPGDHQGDSVFRLESSREAKRGKYALEPAARHETRRQVENNQAYPLERDTRLDRGIDTVRNQVKAPTVFDVGSNEALSVSPASQERIDNSIIADPAPSTTIVEENQASIPLLSTEERRKRREAIKAKYRAAETADGPVETSQLKAVADASTGQAVTKINAEATPTAVSHAASSSPRPLSDTANADDVTVTQATSDVILDPTAPENDFNAADFDPVADADADRVREELRRRGASSAAGGNVEANMIGPGENATAPKKKRKLNKDDLFDFLDGDTDLDDDDSDDGAPLNPADVEGRDMEDAAVDIWDDISGYYILHIGEIVKHQYKLIAKLGSGSFSNVFDAVDIETGNRVAIKFMRSGEAFNKSGHHEVKYLKMLREHDPENKRHAIRFIDCFNHRSHFCIVFEGLKHDLRTQLKKNGFNGGLHISAVRVYAKQIFSALALFRKCGILHIDLKPDNILVDETDRNIKVCDMGSATEYPLTEINTYLASRYYRSPELLLGMQIDYATDMWAVGCTLFELYTAKIMYPGQTNNQMLKQIMQCRGKIPVKMLKKAQMTEHWFVGPHYLFNSFEENPLDKGHLIARHLPMNVITNPFKHRVLAAANAEVGPGNRLTPNEFKEVELFIDLLDKCLQVNPEKRITPADALKHPFIYRPAAVPQVVKKPTLIKPSGPAFRKRKL